MPMNINISLNSLRLKIIVISFASLIMFSCAHTQDNKFSDKKLTQCVSPKAEVCTKEYKPVCGFETDGNYRTFSNACMACSVAEINAYDDGVCK